MFRVSTPNPTPMFKSQLCTAHYYAAWYNAFGKLLYPLKPNIYTPYHPGTPLLSDRSRYIYSPKYIFMNIQLVMVKE